MRMKLESGSCRMPGVNLSEMGGEGSVCQKGRGSLRVLSATRMLLPSTGMLTVHMGEFLDPLLLLMGRRSHSHL